MPDLGPHAAFILAAYAVTFIAVAVLIAFIVQEKSTASGRSSPFGPFAIV